MPTPSSESPRRADSATPPSGPAPVLHSFATSRGPSPLTLGGAEVVPLAVAFQVILLKRRMQRWRCPIHNGIVHVKALSAQVLI